MVQETKVKSSVESKSSPISAKEVKAFDCSPTISDTVAGNLHDVDSDVLPVVTVDAKDRPSGSTDDLPEVVTASGSLPPGSYDSYADEPGAPEGLGLDKGLRTYAGDLDYRRDRIHDELAFGHRPPMSLPTRERYQPAYGPMMSASSPRSPSSYQFPPRDHFLRTSQRGRGRGTSSGSGRTAYPELFELRITIFREVRDLTYFNQFIPEINKMLKIAMREERVDMQAVHKNPHDFGVVLTFHVRPYNYMHEKMVTNVRSQMLKLAWEWRNYYEPSRYADDAETYEALYFFLETCEVNLCRMTQKSGRMNSTRGRGSFEDFQKKPTKQPKNHRSRQNLVKKEYETVKELLGRYLIADKTYLRGKKVAFIQVKCPTALKKNAAFITSIVEDSNVQITRATVPLSRKKEGQLKGFLVYLETESEECVTHIIEKLFTQEYKDAGIKCKYGVFNKKSEELSQLNADSVPPPHLISNSAEPQPQSTQV